MTSGCFADRYVPDFLGYEQLLGNQKVRKRIKSFVFQMVEFIVQPQLSNLFFRNDLYHFTILEKKKETIGNVAFIALIVSILSTFERFGC